MSAMRSASSITRIPTWSRSSSLRSSRSIMRPGVATAISMRFCRLRTCFSSEVPP